MSTIHQSYNRIDYIVSENPEGVAQLLYEAGYEIPDHPSELIQATKEWIRLEGRDAIQQLLTVHPEREAILSANSTYDHFAGCGCESAYSGCGCGCQSNYSGELDLNELMDELSQLAPSELKRRYEELKQLVKKNPEDTQLRTEMELTWDQLRPQEDVSPQKTTTNQKKSVPDSPQNSNVLFEVTRKDLVVGSFILGLAVVVSRINF